MSINHTEEDYLIKDKRPASDRYNLVYIIVFITGIGTLLPWNFFITISPYFIFKLADNSTTADDPTKNTDLQKKFLNYLSLASMVPISLTNLLNLVIRRHITPMRRFTVGIFVMFLMFLVTVVFTKISTENHQIMFFTVTMISVAVLNCCSGIIQGSSLGIISMMPYRYIKAFMEGQALSGMIAAVANIISITLSSKPDKSAFIYFIIALIILIITGFGFRMLERMRFSKNYVRLSSLMDKTVDDIPDVTFSNQDIQSTSITTIGFKEKYIPVVKAIKWEGLTVAMVFGVTLSLYPTFPSKIETTSANTTWQLYFSPITCFLCYNITDYLGRVLCGFVKQPSAKHPRLLFLISTLRLVFIPIYFMCNIPDRQHFPKLLVHDAYPIVITLLFGLTNGYLITLSLIYAPNKVEDRDKESVGTLMSLFMCFGLAIGVSIGFVYLYII